MSQPIEIVWAEFIGSPTIAKSVPTAVEFDAIFRLTARSSALFCTFHGLRWMLQHLVSAWKFSCCCCQTTLLFERVTVFLRPSIHFDRKFGQRHLQFFGLGDGVDGFGRTKGQSLLGNAEQPLDFQQSTVSTSTLFQFSMTPPSLRAISVRYNLPNAPTMRWVADLR